MRQWTGSALVHLMARRLFGAKRLSKPMLGYFQLDTKELQWDSSKNIKTFIREKYRLWNGGHFVQEEMS